MNVISRDIDTCNKFNEKLQYHIKNFQAFEIICSEFYFHYHIQWNYYRVQISNTVHAFALQNESSQ